MNILVLGSTGFIGTNLIFKLAEDKNNSITAFDRTNSSFDIIKDKCGDSVKIVRGEFSDYDDFETLTKDIDIVYHLVSTTNPSLSNRDMKKEMADNVGCTISLLDACVKNKVKKLVFISSGGISGICKAIKEANKVGKITVIASGRNPVIESLIKEGIVTATISQNPVEQGKMAVLTAFNMMTTNKKPDFDKHLVDINAVLFENCN